MARSKQLYRLINVSRGQILADRSEKVADPIRRGIGLIGRKALPDGGGLIIQPCNSVVSFFMRFPIDVIFVDDRGSVLYLLPDMVPWRTSKIVRGSKLAIELPAGTAARSGTQMGDVIQITEA